MRGNLSDRMGDLFLQRMVSVVKREMIGTSTNRLQVLPIPTSVEISSAGHTTRHTVMVSACSKIRFYLLLDLALQP